MDKDDPFDDDDDEFDDLLVSVLEDTTGILSSSTANTRSENGAKNVPVFVDGFDRDAGRTWIFPTNKQVRDYQYNIVKKSLVINTLVCLPTGLGKTFIAAVVMYNFYRWFPRGKVIFMAPTKPLVAQQIEACFEVMGIPQSDMSEMTGSMLPKNRTIAWKEKRVFFLTPQVISNDISRGICPIPAIKCVVVDEAHKALGNQSYVQVVRELHNNGGIFRVLALSATPGSGSTQIQQVITNLLIANLEVRTDESIDIVPYIHHRKVDKVVVELDAELIEMRTRYLEVIDVYFERLRQYKVIAIRNLESLSCYQLLLERNRFRAEPPRDLHRMQYGAVEGCFAIAMSLYHALELLQFYGMYSFYVFWNESFQSNKGSSRNRYELKRNVTFSRIMGNLERRFNKVSDGPNSPILYSHPKHKKLEEIVLNHFKEYEGATEDTRIIVFAQYRESVREIETILNRHHPILRPVVLVGHDRANGSVKGLNQKLQLEVMNDFRSGKSNILIATCIGEEGLDVGDVDLIVCFDAQQSPIRLVQRMGRTGRKRDGRVVVLVTKGKEEGQHVRGQCRKRAFHRAMTDSFTSYEMFPLNARMIPSDIEPVCHKMFLAAGVFVQKEKSGKRSPIESKQPKKVSPHLNDEQLKEWKTKYYVPPNEVAQFDFGPQMVSLSSSSKINALKKDFQPSRGPTLSLIEWLPWQDTLNPTFLVDHTRQTELFVDTMKFLELSACDVETDEQMKSYESNVRQTKERCAENDNVDDIFGLRMNKEVLYEEPDEEHRLKLGSVEPECVEIVHDYENFSPLRVQATHIDSNASFFDGYEKIDDDSVIDKPIDRVSIRTPPSSPPIDATCVIDYLDAIDLVENDDDEILTESAVVCSSASKMEDESPFKTPHPMGSVRKVLASDTPVSTMIPSTSRAFLDVPKSCDVPTKPIEESLYSISQLLGIIDHSTTQTPGSPSKPSIESRSVTEERKEDPLVVDLAWDSDDDDLFDCDVIPPTPEKNPNVEVKSFTRHSTEFGARCSTSTPVTTATCRVRTSPASEDESLMPIARIAIRQKRPRRLDLSSSDSDTNSNAVKQKSKVCREGGRMFLIEEAEVSSESAVSADETFSEDSYDQSFVDDRHYTNDETSAAMYLRSVKSPRARPGAFKIHVRGAVNTDVYSQAVTSQDSDYLEDSFCVDNNSDETTPPKRRRIVTNDDNSSDETMITSPNVAPVSPAILSKILNPLPLPSSTKNLSKLPVTSCSSATQVDKIVVLVNSLEVSGCQTVISDLRIKHNVHVIVSHLGSCDYIVSNRLAVERKFVSDLANRAFRKKLVDRIDDMSENYERTCLIVEKDRTKPNEQARAHSKYAAGLLAWISNAVSKMIFTKSQEHTAEMLFHLANSEARSGYGIEAKHVEREDDPVFNFYRKILENNFIAAANLATKFPSLKDFFKSSPEEISRCAFLSVRKAERIHQIAKQTF